MFYLKLPKNMNPKDIEFKSVTNAKFKYISNTVDADGRQYIYAISYNDKILYQEEPDENQVVILGFQMDCLYHLIWILIGKEKV